MHQNNITLRNEFIQGVSLSWINCKRKTAMLEKQVGFVQYDVRTLRNFEVTYGDSTEFKKMSNKNSLLLYNNVRNLADVYFSNCGRKHHSKGTHTERRIRIGMNRNESNGSARMEDSVANC